MKIGKLHMQFLYRLRLFYQVYGYVSHMKYSVLEEKQSCKQHVIYRFLMKYVNPVKKKKNLPKFILHAQTV